MYKFILLSATIIWLTGSVMAQINTVKGKVIDAETNEPLAFVSMVINDGAKGGMTDIDGNFKLTSKQEIEYLKLSYVGYHQKKYYVKESSSFLTIKLKNKKTKLSEVAVFPGENPAHRIIKKTVENRKINNPEKLHSFSYNSYNKFIVTAVRADTIADTNLFITDTVEIQKILHDTLEQEDEIDIIAKEVLKSIELDSSQIVSILQDTAFMHALIKPALNDTLFFMAKLGAAFIRDNPHLVKQYLTKVDSTIEFDSLTPKINAFTDRILADSINSENILTVIDTVLRSPQVLKVLVPVIQKVLSDSAIMSKIIPYMELNEMIMDKLTEVEIPDTGGFDINKQHIFLMESVTERKFLHPENSKEKVLATRVSGFRDPLFVLLASQVQSFSFYDNVINIGKKAYVNPISPGSTRKYLFLIEDTLYSGNDTIFVITYQPKRNKNFEALEGVLYINTNTYALQNVIAKSAQRSILSTKIEQKYEYLGNKQWFPVQLNTEITLGIGDADITNDGEKMTPVGAGRTYIKNIKINPELKRREFDHIVVDVDENAADKKNGYWDEYRIAPLDPKEIRTYEFLDSIGKEINIEKYTRSFFIFRSGFIPVWKFSFDIKEVVRYNDFEGLRLGLATKTNHRLSEWFRLGGYFAYGTRDKAFKYGGGVRFFIDKNSEFEAGAFYSNDVAEHGVEEIYQDKSLFSDAFWRSFLIKEMAKVKKYGMQTELRTLRYFKMQGMVNVYDYFTGFNPSFSNIGETAPNRYNITEVSAGFRYAYKEKIIRTPQQQFIQTFSDEPVKTKYPTIWFQYTAGMDLLGGEHTYSRYDVKLEKSFYMKYFGTSSFKLEGGYIDTEVPFVRLYNGRSSYRLFTIASSNSFATMHMDEFFSDRYASLFFDHNFGKLIIRTERFTPEFHIVTNMIVGDLINQGEDIGNYNTLEKGYFESGLAIRKFLNLKLFKIGLGAYYRYGEYAFDDQIDNFSFRFSVNSPF